MRSKALLIAAVIAALLTSNALAQQTTRIKFPRGAIHADVSGTLNSFRSKRVFVIKVRDGQTLRTEQLGGALRRITIFVKDATGNEVGDADASCNDRKEVSPTVAGDYTIEVVECQKADPWRGRFTFRVTVR